MTVGEKIQTYRKRAGMSQDELGQKLLVSRQTISLWEKDQTVPTIDNLIRLREVFGVSFDDILCFESTDSTGEMEQNEAYTFRFTRDELNEIQTLQRKAMLVKPIVFAAISILLFISFLATYTDDFFVGCIFGICLFGAVAHIKAICAYNAAWKSSIERVGQSTYEYKVYDNYFQVSICRHNEKVYDAKCYFFDVEQFRKVGKWLILQIGGQLFIIRKNDLKENSAFFSYMYKTPSKVTEVKVRDKWGYASVALFVASILSPLSAMYLVTLVSAANELFVENMWLFFLLTPIPIASFVLGLMLKAKGYKYKKNIVVAIIITAILCIYGTFAFIFPL